MHFILFVDNQKHFHPFTSKQLLKVNDKPPHNLFTNVNHNIKSN